MKIISNVAKYKFKNKVSVVQNKRMESIFEKQKKLAREKGIDPNLVQRLYKEIIKESIKIEKKLIKEFSKKED
jgi:chorismate mutase